MANVAWPAGLPQAQIYGQSERPAGLVASFTTSEGLPPLRRRRFSGLAVTTAYSFIMTSAQMTAFRTWWDGPLACGVNDIIMFDHSVNANVRLTPVEGSYEATAVSFGVWQVTIPVRREVL